MMNKLLFGALILGLFVFSVPAQSGRRVKPAPTPIAARENTDDADFSESKPTDGPSYSRKKAAQAQKEVQPKADTTVTDGTGDDVIKVETSLDLDHVIRSEEPSYSRRKAAQAQKEVQPKADTTVTDGTGDDVIKVETSLDLDHVI